MKTVVLNYRSPEVLEAKRKAEMTSLSYFERLQGSMAIIEVCYMFKQQKKKNLKGNE